MKISNVCIDRPVFATVLSLVIVLLGLVSFSKLTVREYPQTDSPVVSVQTTYAGASADIMESQVTQVLEESLSGIEGIDYMTSSSQQGRSRINITFNMNRDPDSAAADVRDRVSRSRGRLPMDVDEPVIAKVEADSQPIMFVSFSSDRMSPMELSDFVDRYVLDQLQTVPGVATVNQIGERKYSMRIWLDAQRMAAYGVTPQDVANALRQQNVEVPAGLVEGKYREYSVLTETDLKTPEDFNNLVIRKTGSGYLVRLIDVGRAELGPADTRFAMFNNGRTAYGLGITKQATANPLDISNAVRAIMPRIRKTLPPGMQAEVIVDFSRSIRESIKNVYETILEAMVLVIAVIFLFLRSLRATLVPLITIPVSLIGSIGLMYLLGFSINTLTLLAMVLAIGLVVDDAIVMLENIYRHVEAGMQPIDAAKKGAAEMGFAVVAMSLTLAAVYVPVSFMGGTSGRLFTEFAITLAAAVLISGFVALTASPMMCSKLLKSHEKHGRLYQAMENFFERVSRGYRSTLIRALHHRKTVLAVGAGLAAAGVVLFVRLPTELAPLEDGGDFPIMFQAPEGSTIDYTEKYGREIQKIAQSIPEAETVMEVIGFGSDVTSGRVFVELKPWSERSRTPQQIIPTIMGKLRDVPGVRAFPILSPPLGGGHASKPIQIVVQTPEAFEKLHTMVQKFVAALEANGKLTAIDTDLRLDKPQVKIDIDRDKAADLGIDARTLGQTLGILVGGQQITRFKKDGQEYDVIVRLTEPFRSNPDDLRNIYIRAANGQLVQLANLVKVTETVAPRSLSHFDQLRSATVSANLAPGVSLGEGLATLQQIAKETLPSTARLEYTGQLREFLKSSSSIYTTFGLAIVFIFLVLAAQFESFRSPFIILLTVPLSIAGGLFALWLAGASLNIYSQVGLITLIGLITKHGILIVEFSNQNREAGMDLIEAVVEAATLRLRPILMTTGAMVFGAIPLVIATGAGAASRESIGLVIVGGLLIGTIFTL
ncbi:MAG TPA: efflux RND transporter permease subunit, partial [Alphaproteobacteria bacterium]|nr:efflux RND transporter permease subunit [Alphaproteobacteria bacterium]